MEKIQQALGWVFVFIVDRSRGLDQNNVNVSNFSD